MLENAFGFTERIHIIFSIVLLFVTNLWLGWLFYKFSAKNTFITGICLLLLASIEIMAGINANSGTLTMITIRNIEIPIIISLFYAIIRHNHFLSAKNAFYVAALSLLFASDFLLLFVAVLGLPIFFVINQYSPKQRKLLLEKIKDSSVFFSTLTAAAGVKVIHVLASLTGLATFYEMEGSNDSLSFIGSFEEMFRYTLQYIGEIIRVFGGSFFGVNIFSGGMYVVNFLFFVFTIYLIAWLLQKQLRNPSSDSETRIIILLLATHLFAMLTFTILIPRELAGRYFAFLPIIGLLILAYKFKDFQFKLTISKNMQALVLLVASALLLTFFAVLILGANKTLYQKKYAHYSSEVGDTARIVNILEKENVSALIHVDYYERGFWNNHVIKQQYDQKTNKQLAITSVFCGGSVVDRQFSRRSWSTPNGSRVALRLIVCDPDDMKDIFGQPSKSYPLGDHDTLYIYDHDIRNKLDMRQYDENRFIKK